MKTVIIESPYRPIFNKCHIPIIGYVINIIKYKIIESRNVRYAKACMADSLYRNEAPFLSHLLYPQVLDDRKKDGRELGINAGLAWYGGAFAAIFYTDLGMSDGMNAAEKYAQSMGIKREYRSLIGWGKYEKRYFTIN